MPSSPHQRQEPMLPSRTGPHTDPADGAEPTTGAEPALPGQWSRDELVAHLVFALYDHRQSLDGRGRRLSVVRCSSCGDAVPGWQAPMLGGKCVECYLELYVGVMLAEPTLDLNSGVLDEVRRELRRRQHITEASTPPPQLASDEEDEPRLG